MPATSDDIVEVSICPIIKGMPWDVALTKAAKLLENGYRKEDAGWMIWYE